MNNPDMTNDPINTTREAAAEYHEEMDRCVRRNPSTAILFAVGAGLAIGLLVRALRPEPTPQHRVARLLEDLEDRLRDATGPLLKRGSALASDGYDAAQEGTARAGSIINDATRRVRRLFS